MNIETILAANLATKFANRFNKMLTFHIADRTTNLNNVDIGTEMLRILKESLLDHASHVRDQLNGVPAEFTCPLRVNQTLIKFTRGPNRVTGHFLVKETFIMPEIQVGLSSVLGHKALTVLARIKQPSIYV